MHVNDMTENSIIESGEFSRLEIISLILIQERFRLFRFKKKRKQGFWQI